jgi:hypothetical protein
MLKRSQLFETSPDCVEILLFFFFRKIKGLEQKAGNHAGKKANCDAPATFKFYSY